MVGNERLPRVPGQSIQGCCILCSGPSHTCCSLFAEGSAFLTLLSLQSSSSVMISTKLFLNTPRKIIFPSSLPHSTLFKCLVLLPTVYNMSVCVVDYIKALCHLWWNYYCKLELLEGRGRREHSVNWNKHIPCLNFLDLWLTKISSWFLLPSSDWANLLMVPEGFEIEDPTVLICISCLSPQLNHKLPKDRDNTRILSTSPSPQYWNADTMACASLEFGVLEKLMNQEHNLGHFFP